MLMLYLFMLHNSKYNPVKSKTKIDLIKPGIQKHYPSGPMRKSIANVKQSLTALSALQTEMTKHQ